MTRGWRRGGSIDDAPVIFEGLESDVGVWPFSVYSDGAIYAFITRAVTFHETEHYRVDENGDCHRLPFPAKSDIKAVIGGLICAVLQEDWTFKDQAYPTGAVVAYDPDKDEVELVYAPGPREAVGGVAATQARLLIQRLDNVIGKVTAFERKRGAWARRDIETPGDGAVALGATNPIGEDLFFYFDSPTTPQSLFHADGDGGRCFVKQNPSFFDVDGVAVRRFEATSSDGEKIPYTVIGRERLLVKGPAPTIQYGYGGFDVPITAGYMAVAGKLWLERGGLYVIANIRGGGEFGPRWHQAALKHQRQRAFDDFFAVSEDLINRKLTTRQMLGAYGGSNGGLLMGVAMTQRPDLYKALAIGVPLLDMLRFHKLLAGASWVAEYGDPEKPEDRAILEAYSPYHRLSADKDYPTPFIFTSTRDDRVHPGHARKMAAKMSDLGFSYYYYENIEGGHGAAANRKQEAKRAALQYVYFSKMLMD
ncbi:MAG: prolyl oligopeptidase family serine peptidase [Pseudomonadota bacterium]